MRLVTTALLRRSTAPPAGSLLRHGAVHAQTDGGINAEASGLSVRACMFVHARTHAICAACGYMRSVWVCEGTTMYVVHARVYARVHARVHVRVHAHVHVRVRARAHAHTHMHTHTHHAYTIHAPAYSRGCARGARAGGRRPAELGHPGRGPGARAAARVGLGRLLRAHGTPRGRDVALPSLVRRKGRGVDGPVHRGCAGGSLL